MKDTQFVTFFFIKKCDFRSLFYFFSICDDFFSFKIQKRGEDTLLINKRPKPRLLYKTEPGGILKYIGKKKKKKGFLEGFGEILTNLFD